MSKLQEEAGKSTQELRESCLDTTPEPVEKWSVGSYIVPLQDRLLTRDEPLIKGKPYQITKCMINPYIMCERGLEINFRRGNNTETTEGIKWFATKSEAEEFAKTLVEPVKEEVNQPLKQAVHCKTQEEINYIREKFGHSKNTNQFEFYGEVAYYLDTKGFDKINDVKCRKNYQIISFQEWCDLDGYKMEKEVKFEVGKWYSIKTAYNWIIKFKEIKDGNIKADWYCLNERGKKVEEGGYWESKPTEIKELSIEEIQQYLTDNHPDKIKFDQEFKVGDWVIIKSWHYNEKNIQLGQIAQIEAIDLTNQTPYKLNMSIAPKGSNIHMWYFKLGEFIHATPKEINNHLISTGQIPAGEPLNTGIEPNKDNSYSCISGNHRENPQCTFNSIKINGQEILKPKMILSTDDEELPMVNIIKTNTIKQLLNVE